MRFLHTSDWHLGMTYRSGVSYIEDQKKFIDEIADIAIREKVDGILIAGDIFDKSIASQDALKIYDEAMTILCGRLDVPVFIIAGNHDGAERLASCNKLLEKSGLYIAGSLKKNPRCINMGDVDIYLLPWISTDKVKAVYPELENQINSLEDAYRIVLDDYRAGFVKGHKHIVVSHAYIANAETSTSDKTAEIGKATVVDASVFEGFDYVALGHLHGPQQINRHIRYSGTPMAYSFGKEEKQEKSVTIYDSNTDSVEVIPLHPYRCRTSLEGTYEELMELELADEVRQGYIKLDVKDCVVGLDVIATFRGLFPNLLEIDGKSLENADAKITMTLDELESEDTDPEVVFGRYCVDMIGEEPSEHILDIFRRAYSRFENGEEDE